MKHKLIAVALITVLICMVLGNGIACTPTTTYTLAISSTAGGSVTTPVEGTYTYAANATVPLVATPDSGYRFVNWTATAGTFGSATAATTTFAMPAQDATVTAHFALGILIADVPDTNQPPTATIPSTVFITNYCAPMAMVNVLGYWDVVMGHANAENLTAFQPPPNPLDTVAEYLGYFMDTNNTGSPARVNPGAPGTYDVDIAPGTLEFVRWDGANPYPPAPPPVLPGGKLGYDWVVTPDYGVVGLDFYTDEIDAGRPLVACFNYWNPADEDIAVIDPETGETIDVFSWGEEVFSSYDPEEYWTDDIGHAVTGVGYILNWDPDGSGPLLEDDYVIVHDNWSSTPENVAIPWANWKSNHSADPGP